MNNYSKKPLFHLGSIVPPADIIDRKAPVSDTIEALLAKRENVLIVGKRRIGKTSLLAKLVDELDNSSVLTLEINLMAYDSHPSYFLREILLLLCYKVGKVIFKKDTVDLLSSLGDKPTSIKTDFGKFYEIFKLARFLSASKTRSSSVDASLSTPIIGGVSSSKRSETSLHLDDLQPYEFIQLTDDLMDICRKHGYDSVVVFADEANRLALETSKELLATYFEVFSSKDVLFVFTADVNIIDYKLLSEIFGTTIFLSPFDSIEDLKALLEHYYSTIELDYLEKFSKEAISQIWRISTGHPYIIQLLCSSSIDVALLESHSAIEKQDVMQAWLDILDEDPNIVTLTR